MPIELKVPEVGESITEVEIGEWLVAPGDAVSTDQSLVMIETDKVTVELPAPTSGTITKILKQTGDMAEVGDVIGVMEQGDAPKLDAAAASASPIVPVASAASSTMVATVMPAAARVLAERGIDAAAVQATGPGGRLLKEDALAHSAGSSPQVQASAQPSPKALPSGQSSQPTGENRAQEKVAMTSLRRRVAKRLVAAQQDAALLTTFNEVDMSAVMELRSQYKQAYVDKHGVKLGFMSFFVKAAIDALNLIPQVNAQIQEGHIVYHHYCDIGVAVGGGRGLVVPVLRNAERMSFAEVETTILDLAKKAKANKLAISDLTGGTFTISNGGVYGSMLSTPIVNPPQSGILGLHNIQERAVVIGGEVVVRPMMYLALTYDHRIIDGREAVTFLKRIKECIENPARMLLEI